MKKNIKPLYIGIFVVLFGIIGGTIAYFGTNNTFENVFNTSEYIIETTELFESPANWMPGDVTPKVINVTNKGDVPAAVRIWFEESWVDKNGNPLPVNYNVTTTYFADSYQDYWLNSNCDNDPDVTDYFYYYKIINPNETTRDLIDAVAFESYYRTNDTIQCTTEGNTQVCNSTWGDYTGGKYTLTAHIETVQASEVANVWGNPMVRGRQDCEPLNLRSANYMSNFLAQNNGSEQTIFGKKLGLEKNSFERITIVNNMNVPNNAIDSWDASEIRDQSVKAWYTDTDNNGKYELYLGANGKVRANPNSASAFSNFQNLTYIDVRNLDTSEVEDMGNMFKFLGHNSSSIIMLGFEDFNTSNVEDMGFMFYQAGGNWQTIDFSNWDISNVVYHCEMFAGCKFYHLGTDDWDTIIGENCPLLG